jgi:hypothetical protein
VVSIYSGLALPDNCTEKFSQRHLAAQILLQGMDNFPPRLLAFVNFILFVPAGYLRELLQIFSCVLETFHAKQTSFLRG